MAKGIKKLMAIARLNVSRQIRSDAGYGDNLSHNEHFFARGIAVDGFNGGYQAALDDVLLALNGVVPQRNGWWSHPLLGDDDENKSH